jgi:hypothetical protein
MSNDPQTDLQPYKIGLRCWLSSFLILTAAILLQFLASQYPEKVETYYSRKLYPYIGQSLSLFNKLFAFSLAEFLIIILSVTLPLWLLWKLRKIYLKQLSFKTFFLKTSYYCLVFTGVSLLFFLLIWGLNYQKQPLIENLNLNARKADPDELIKVCKYFIDQTNKSYLEASSPNIYLTDNKSNTTINNKLPEWSSLNATIEDSFQKEPLLKYLTFGTYAPAKAVYFSGVMSRLGISGIFIPLTGEANVNVAQPTVTIPFTLAHEKAHQRGFAREDEANFIAFLISTKAENPYCRYSGYLLTTIHLMNSLYLINPQEYESLYKNLAYGPRMDLKTISQFWAYYEGKLSKVSEKVNNSYLKANQVRSGVENYNEVVELVVSYYFRYLSSNNTDTFNFTLGNKL